MFLSINVLRQLVLSSNNLQHWSAAIITVHLISPNSFYLIICWSVFVCLLVCSKRLMRLERSICFIRLRSPFCVGFRQYLERYSFIINDTLADFRPAVRATHESDTARRMIGELDAQFTLFNVNQANHLTIYWPFPRSVFHTLCKPPPCFTGLFFL